MNNSTSPVPISPVEDIIADMRAGRMVILVDEEETNVGRSSVAPAERVHHAAVRGSSKRVGAVML